MMNQKTVDSFPLTLALSPRGKRVKLENQLRGRGDNRKKIHTIISDRVKYTYVPGPYKRLPVSLWQFRTQSIIAILHPDLLVVKH